MMMNERSMKRFAPRRPRHKRPLWQRLVLVCLGALAALALAPYATAGLAWALATVGGGHALAVAGFVAAVIAGAFVAAM